MKKILHTTLSTLLAFSLCGCINGSSQTTTSSSLEKFERVCADSPNKEFSEYLDEVVKEGAESDFTTVHQLFENPEDFGIDMKNVEVNLGYFDEDETEEDEILDQLEDFDYESLDKTQQNIYDQLLYERDLADELNKDKYKYMENIWSSTNGQHQILVTFFSEYLLRNEQDIKDLITLIKDVPRYVDEALEYTKKQADANLLYIDLDAVLEDTQNVIDTKEDSAIANELFTEVDQLQLDNEKAEEYKKQIQEAFDSCFIPSYEKIVKELSALESKNHDLCGLANIENGEDYYELLVKNATGSSEDIETIRSNIQDAANTALISLQKLMSSNPSVFDDMSNVSTGFTSPEEIMIFLSEHYSKNYKETKEMNYEINPLSDEQSAEGIVAYFVTPAIDNTSKYQIRYNKRDYGDDMSSLDTYTTFAHEGIPGHMYQAQYDSENTKYNITYMFDCLGMSEGYATYVQLQSLDYLDSIDSDVLKAYKYNEILTDLYISLMDISIHYDGLSYDEFVDEYSDLFGEDLLDLYNQLADNPTTFLSYYYGYLQIIMLKNEVKDSMGLDFNIKEFNTVLLDNGRVNFDIIKKNMSEYVYN